MILFLDHGQKISCQKMVLPPMATAQNYKYDCSSKPIWFHKSINFPKVIVGLCLFCLFICLFPSGLVIRYVSGCQHLYFGRGDFLNPSVYYNSCSLSGGILWWVLAIWWERLKLKTKEYVSVLDSMSNVHCEVESRQEVKICTISHLGKHKWAKDWDSHLWVQLIVIQLPF